MIDSIQRWAVKLEYNGHGYVGWQKQKEGLSIQQELEKAASCLSRGAIVPSITAGRTDSGVHALGQVAHLDFPADLPLTAKQVRDGLNFYLKPNTITVLQAASVELSWSARFSATKRIYRYQILNRPSRPALDIGHVWHVKRPLDIQKMYDAAQMILGKHDFTSYRAQACQALSPIRTLDRFDIQKKGELIVFEIEARSFLHHQVRNMVGTLKRIGENYWPKEQALIILQRKNRCIAGPTAPPEGLFLKEIYYDPDPFSGK